MNEERIKKLIRELIIEMGEDPTREGLAKTPVGRPSSVSRRSESPVRIENNPLRRPHRAGSSRAPQGCRSSRRENPSSR